MTTTAPGTTAETETTAETTVPVQTESVTAEKGDLKFDGEINAEDAAILLRYAAAVGAGESAMLCSADDPAAEAAARNNADTDANQTIDAVDASNILIYAAILGAEGSADWADVLGTT